MRQVERYFGNATSNIESAIEYLAALLYSYKKSDVPERKARVRSLESKIDALQAVRAGLNPNAEPWSKDEL